MSWNKQLSICSKIDAFVEVLELLNEPYELIELARYDDPSAWAMPEDTFPIRRLTFKNKVVLEQYKQNNDCDMNDDVVSYTYDIDKEPQDWETKVCIDLYEDVTEGDVDALQD